MLLHLTQCVHQVKGQGLEKQQSPCREAQNLVKSVLTAVLRVNTAWRSFAAIAALDLKMPYTGSLSLPFDVDGCNQY